MMNYGNMGWGMGFGWVIGLLVIGLLFWLIYTSVQSTTKTSRNEIDSAKEILRKRFAKGEISKEEFEEMSKELD
ncbi:MAG: SHOCT domain-containing protein [Chlorobi bacterium]|nr:SHOCT domain-containing protein [Chlorobiota bacterium]